MALVSQCETNCWAVRLSRITQEGRDEKSVMIKDISLVSASNNGHVDIGQPKQMMVEDAVVEQNNQ